MESNLLKIKKFLRFRNLLLLMFFTTTTMLSKEYQQKISLQLNNVKVTDVFTAIEQKTSYTFVYQPEVAQINKKISIAVVNRTVEEILQDVSLKANLSFKTVSNVITVKIKAVAKQNHFIKGQVTDSQGVPLPGAAVVIKNTTNGTSTDFEGNFTLETAKQSAVLVVTYMGHKTQEVIYNGEDFLQITLQEDVNALDEVVVTALGIKRQEKKLGFAQTTINSDQISHTSPANWSSGLKGKVAGLNIVSSGTGPINSQQITLRGNNSLNPNGNYALIVVDGVPLNAEMTSNGSGSAYLGDDNPVDFGNAVSELNADDIESVTVLKGPGATALYGSRAANGALVITTKAGKKQKGLGVTVSSSLTFDAVTRWPDYQYEYGQGTGNSFNDEGEPYYSYGASEDGSNTGSTSSAWGPRFEGQYYYQYDPTLQGQSAERQLWRAYEDNIKGFWRTGVTSTNRVDFQGGNEKGSIRASLGYTDNEWIMPNTGFEKINVSTNANYQISDAIKLSTVVNYSNRTSDNIPGSGYNNGSIAYFTIFQNPNVDLDWYRPIWEEGQENLQQLHPFSSYIDNPYLIAYEATNPLENDQILGNVRANIQLAPKWELMLRSSLNMYTQQREQQRPYSINRYARGFYKRQDITKKEVNTDFLLTFNDSWQNFSVNASVGGNALQYNYNRMDAYVDALVVPNVYKLANGVNNPIVSTHDRNKKVNSLYGLVSIAYKDMVYLDVTGRNDWSSTLPSQNNSFFYPSANASVIVSEMFTLPKSISFAKYRLSYAQVGNDTNPYQTSKYYSQNSFASSATVPLTLYNPNFKPEITTSYETGIDVRFLNNRIGLDATYYQTNTKNQIISVPIDITTGYNRAILNSGEVRNRGVELALNVTPIKTADFTWKSTINWSKNWNKVLELADGIDNQQEIGSGGSATMIAKVGESATAIYGYGFVRDPEGNIVYDSAGLPAYPDEIMYIGDATPDWRAGMFNTFTYKNFSLAVTLDGQYGGMVYSQSHHKLTQQGKLTSTFYGREEGFIVGDGVVDNGDGTYSPNTVEVAPQNWYNRYYRRANVESNTFDASFLKLREVSLGYSFPKSLLKGTGLQSAKISVFGRNLAMISDFPIYDPETSALNDDTYIQGVEMGQLPTPSSYGFNLQIQF